MVCPHVQQGKTRNTTQLSVATWDHSVLCYQRRFRFDSCNESREAGRGDVIAIHYASKNFRISPWCERRKNVKFPLFSPIVKFHPKIDGENYN
jgi:hypothetical protein